MPLLSMKELLDDAKKHCYAVPAFNILSIEALEGIIKACEDFKSPVILQIAEERIPYSDIEIYGNAILNMAKKTDVKVALHLDHGYTDEMIQKAIQLGFTSVMIDASNLSLQKNIERTKKVVKIAMAKQITVEAEIGRVGDEGCNDIRNVITSVDEALEFVNKTKCDALAVSIGNVHGNYLKKPNLQFDRLKELNAALNLPLVLHGGSGLSDSDYQKCVKNGICKINIATAIYSEIAKDIESYKLLNKYDEFSFIEYKNIIKNTANKVAKEYIRIFNSSGR